MIENSDMPTFKVRSHSNYEVKLGNKECLPSCQCLDWETTRLPCKHFFAVFKCYPKWSFNDLPQHYRESPFLTLDENVMFGPTTHQQNTDSNSYFIEPAQQSSQEQQDHVIYSDIPKCKKYNKTAATKCTEILNGIKSMTYITEDIIKYVNESLLTCLEMLKSAAPTSNNLIVDTGTDTYTKKKTTVLSTNNKYKTIPKPVKRKHPYSGRVGQKAEKMRKL